MIVAQGSWIISPMSLTSLTLFILSFIRKKTNPSNHVLQILRILLTMFISSQVGRPTNIHLCQIFRAGCSLNELFNLASNRQGVCRLNVWIRVVRATEFPFDLQEDSLSLLVLLCICYFCGGGCGGCSLGFCSRPQTCPRLIGCSRNSFIAFLIKESCCSNTNGLLLDLLTFALALRPLYKRVMDEPFQYGCE